MSQLARGEGAANTPAGSRRVKATMGAIHVLTFMVVRNGAGLFDGLRLQKKPHHPIGESLKHCFAPFGWRAKKIDSKVRFTTEMIIL